MHSSMDRGGRRRWQMDRDGRGYRADASAHVVRFRPAAGRAWSVGRAGSGAGEFQSPGGLAVHPAGAAAGTRVFVCDSGNDRIQVLDGRGAVVTAFGGHGSGAGQFRGPVDAAIVAPDLPGEDEPGRLLAVSDSGNDRIQVFALDGTLAGIVSGSGGTVVTDAAPEAGWPFFRLHATPRLTRPGTLTWRAPFLQVSCADGVVRLDLAMSLLPDYAEWRRTAPNAEVDRARRYFAMLRLHRRALPPAVLADLMDGVRRAA